MIDVISKVEICEKNGNESKIGKIEYLTVTSHDSIRKWVCLKLGNITFTVNIGELEAAIKNAETALGSPRVGERSEMSEVVTVWVCRKCGQSAYVHGLDSSTCIWDPILHPWFSSTDHSAATDGHEIATLRHRDHSLIQQLEKDCTKLRQRIDVLQTALKWIRDNPKTDADALRDIAVTVLLSELPFCGNCGHPEHIQNSEVCSICREESINGNRDIEDCCAAYVPTWDSTVLAGVQ